MHRKESLLRPALVLLALFNLLTGVAYPLVVWVIGQLLFPHQANGSQIEVRGRDVGSELIAQRFEGPGWFWPRPSAVAYNAAGSGGSNFATTNPALLDAIRDRVAALRRADPSAAGRPIPVDLVTASGSGLDPDITPASAYFQATRVASARGLDVEDVRRMIAGRLQGRAFGFLGEPRVNVLTLNIALQSMQRPE